MLGLEIRCYGDDHFFRPQDREASSGFSARALFGPGSPLGGTLGPEAALEGLADQDIPFAVKGKTTYEQQMAAIRGPATHPVQ